jgi:hypothetical protein
MHESEGGQSNIIYHYTDAKGAQGILETQSLWATHYRYLNDFSELIIFGKALTSWRQANASQPQHVDLLLKELLEIFIGGRGKPPETEAYIVSFCNDDGDRLSQWRAYGRGDGYALGFDRTELEKLKEKESRINWLDSIYIDDVCYGDSEEMPEALKGDLQNCIELLKARYIDSAIDENVTDDALNEIFNPFVKCLSRFKHKGFSEEKEIRLIVFLPNLTAASRVGDGRLEKVIKFHSSQNMLVPYIELFEGRDTLPIKKIKVGPSPYAEMRKRSIQILLKRKGINPDIVSISQIPYRGR